MPAGVCCLWATGDGGVVLVLLAAISVVDTYRAAAAAGAGPRSAGLSAAGLWSAGVGGLWSAGVGGAAWILGVQS